MPPLPQLLQRKIYKTGQTRGADDDEIYQNRVSRASTVLIPYGVWTDHFAEWERYFENGFIVLISPNDYFGHLRNDADLAAVRLQLGRNALVFYETRAQWDSNPPDALHWLPADSRRNPLGGGYVARIPATTAAGEAGRRIVRGFNTTHCKGAGIRFYEYASRDTIEQCRLQLEMLYWSCADSEAVVIANGMGAAQATTRKNQILDACGSGGLLDVNQLTQARIVNGNGRTICPLCLEELSGQGFFSRMAQTAGREVQDLTITQVNLFHIDELRPGVYNHRSYNLGWGHHHCNVVVKDEGIANTLHWMETILRRNTEQGYFGDANNGN